MSEQDKKPAETGSRVLGELSETTFSNEELNGLLNSAPSADSATPTVETTESPKAQRETDIDKHLAGGLAGLPDDLDELTPSESNEPQSDAPVSETSSAPSLSVPVELHQREWKSQTDVPGEEMPRPDTHDSNERVAALSPAIQEQQFPTEWNERLAIRQIILDNRAEIMNLLDARYSAMLNKEKASDNKLKSK